MYANIYEHTPKKYWLVKVEQDKVKFQKVVHFNKGIRTVLKVRNSIYQEHGLYPQGLLDRMHRPLFSPNSSTNKYGIYEGIDKSGGAGLTKYETYVVRIRHIESRKNSNKTVYRHLFLTDERALRYATREAEKHVKAYNKVVDCYNDLLKQDFENLMEIEEKTLKPVVKTIMPFDRERWALSYSMCEESLAKILTRTRK